MTPQELKNSILQLAIQGKLVEQRPEEGTAEELYAQIQAEKQKLIKAGKIKKEKPLPKITEDEKPFDIPDSWKWVKFSELFEIGSAIRIHQSDWKTEGIPFFRGRELVRLAKTGELNAEIFITEELYEKNKEKGGIPEKDDLLVTAVGTLGKVYVVKGIHPFYYKDAYILHYMNYAHLVPYFFRYVIESPFCQDFIHAKSMRTTVAQLTIHKAKNMLCVLSPLAEQKPIVAKIEELLPLIDCYEKAWTKLEDLNKRFPDDLQKSLLQLAIQGKLVEQRQEEGTAEELYTQIQAEKQKLIEAGKIKKEKPLPKITEDEIPFDIPTSWKWVRLGMIVFVLGGKRIPAGRILTKENTGHIYIRVSDMKNASVLTNNLMYVPKDIYPTISRYIINKEDVYITVAGTIGSVGTIPSELDGANLTENADRLVLQLIDQAWLVKSLQSYLVQNQIADATTKVGQPKLAIMRIQNLLIPLPPLDEQKRIVEKLEKILPFCNKLR